MKNPCTKDCPNRTITCHGVCKRYQAWKEEQEKVKQWLLDHAPVTSQAGLKKHNEKLKHGKSRKWNLKNQYRGDS